MDSLEIAKKYNIAHYLISRIITKYNKEFEMFGEIKFQKLNNVGRPTILKFLNLDHEKLLILLLKNNENNVKLKVEFLKNLK